LSLSHSLPGYHAALRDEFTHLIRCRPAQHSPLRKQKVAHLHLRFMELRFRVAYRAFQHLGNLVMLITFHLMQRENLAASFRKLLHGTAQRNTVDGAIEAWIPFAD